MKCHRSTVRLVSVRFHLIGERFMGFKEDVVEWVCVLRLLVLDRNTALRLTVILCFGLVRKMAYAYNGGMIIVIDLIHVAGTRWMREAWNQSL